MFYPTGLPKLHPLRARINQYYHADETASVKELIAAASLTATEANKARTLAKTFIENVRQANQHASGMEAFMQHYDLSCEEGVLLMCLAEALLRIPDKMTETLLLEDKLASVMWGEHAGESDVTFVNLATRGLQLTSHILGGGKPAEAPRSLWNRLVKRAGMPFIRKAVREAIKLLSQQFVVGETIEQALKQVKKNRLKGYAYSYDMLGEVARTQYDADRYYAAYQHAIEAIAAAAETDDTVLAASSISVKLSALHPRYEYVAREAAIPALVERLFTLCKMAEKVGIEITVDAEEAHRLDLSLDIFAQVFSHPELRDFDKLGLAVQAYQKRAYYVIDWLVELAREQKKKILVRLVKGAYWDYEIKYAQEQGFSEYPVFTRKTSTDVSYFACARKLLQAKDEIYPRFATHNAYTAAAILAMAGDNLTAPMPFEFQHLQGMGSVLHDQIISHPDYPPIRSWVYAPVGVYQDLLPYLVRRLLENGANSSFVNQIVNPDISIESLLSDPVEYVTALPAIPHPNIPLPLNIYGRDRINSKGVDYSDVAELEKLVQEFAALDTKHFVAAPTILADEPKRMSQRRCQAVLSPRDTRLTVGEVMQAELEDVELALTAATDAFPTWQRLSISARADCLRKAADLFEANRTEVLYLAMHEAGKTWGDAIAELREAVDFCRYYAQQAEKQLIPQQLVGPTGETNELQFHGRGVMLCISPWNFPLAIFTGQVTAALVAGNCVIAKPADPTPLMAALAVRILHQAGVPHHVLQLMIGPGKTIGQALVGDKRIRGVLFTGSNATARHIQKTLAEREPIIPLIAETGGMNAMIADSSALPEQLVADVMRSAFGSAGQRCSALRILFVQEDIAETVIEMLAGAMEVMKVDDPQWLMSDVGPVINDPARATLLEHVRYLESKNIRRIAQAPLDKAATEWGYYFAPCVYELPDLSLLTQEIFGPILHVIRFARQDLDNVIEQINGLGYGLTFGIQSRIQGTISYITERMQVGNVYVNRSTIGAVVGVQPFGGCRLSGTGPKAGGPTYLWRLVDEKTVTVNTTATGGNATLMSLREVPLSATEL